MKAAGLKAIDTVVSSTAVLVKSRNPTNPALVDLIASRILGVISEPLFTPHLLSADII
jgi:ATP phosphoribosyltransferase